MPRKIPRKTNSIFFYILFLHFYIFYFTVKTLRKKDFVFYSKITTPVRTTSQRSHLCCAQYAKVGLNTQPLNTLRMTYIAALPTPHLWCVRYVRYGVIHIIWWPIDERLGWGVGAGGGAPPAMSVADEDTIYVSSPRHKEAVPPPGRRQQTPSHTFTRGTRVTGPRKGKGERPNRRSERRPHAHALHSHSRSHSTTLTHITRSVIWTLKSQPAGFALPHRLCTQGGWAYASVESEIPATSLALSHPRLRRFPYSQTHDCT